MRSAAVTAALLAVAAPALALSPQVLKAARAIPVFVAAAFEQPLAFQPAPDGAFYVFDRRAHSVHRIDAARAAVRPDGCCARRPSTRLRTAALPWPTRRSRRSGSRCSTRRGSGLAGSSCPRARCRA